MYSAIKFQGRKLYDYAREGIEIERQARDITIYALEELSYDINTLKIRVSCSKGTYIRKLAEDIGEAFGMLGTLSFLLRSKVGDFTIDKAHTLEEIGKNPEKCALPIELGVKTLPILKVNALQGKRIAQGVPTTIPIAEEGITYAVFTEENVLVGVAKVKNNRVCGCKILNIPEVVEDSDEDNYESRGTEKE